jgi:predicted hydrocarbon binding protein
METFQQIKDQLVLTGDNRLMLNRVPMILTPLWFFAGIMKQVVEKAGEDTASDIFYKAGYDGAYNWAGVQIENGLSGREVIAQYLNSMTCRGWGRFEITGFDTETGKGSFRFFDSAIALEHGSIGRKVCLWVPGALAGGFQAVLDHARSSIRVKGRETACMSQGHTLCEFSVTPIPGNSK